MAEKIPEPIFAKAVVTNCKTDMRYFAKMYRKTHSDSALRLAIHHRDAARRWKARAEERGTQ